MNYHNITKCDMLNGEGLRVVLWLSHCTHNCLGCQNPQTHNANSGIPFEEDAYKEICEELDKEFISGITFSGGDPLSSLNRKHVLMMIRDIKLKYPNKSVWLYTGYKWEQISQLEGIENIDVLIDGLYIQKLKNNNLPYVGSSNQRIIDVKETIKHKKIILYSI
ncbi:MAG: anaerobic ribonucleoside-triphosphate reductase activating protein [Clostridia bacterium]